MGRNRTSEAGLLALVYYGRVVEFDQRDHGGVPDGAAVSDERAVPAGEFGPDGELADRTDPGFAPPSAPPTDPPPPLRDPPPPLLDPPPPLLEQPVEPGERTSVDDSGTGDAASELIYADMDRLRYVVPLLGAVFGLLILGFGGYRLFLSGDDDTSAEDPRAEQESDANAADPLVAAQQVADSFARSFSAGQLADEAYAFDDGREVADEFVAVVEALEDSPYLASVGDVANSGPISVSAVAGPVTLQDDVRASSSFETTWTLTDGTSFSTVGELDLVLIGIDWLPDWKPSVIESSLSPGDSFVVERLTAGRAPILDVNGFELVGERAVVQVGVIARQAGEIEPLANQLAAQLGLDGAELYQVISRSPSDALVPVAQRRIENLDQIRAQVGSIPGVVLTETSAMLTPYEGYARGFLGSTGQVTADVLERSPDQFAPGDTVGRSGLQALYNDSLAGTPGFRVRIQRRFPLTGDDGVALPIDADPNIVYLSEPTLGAPLRTTIDHNVQLAAESALSNVQLPASLVAVRASTGEVLAVGNGPGSAGNNFALTGQYPPGSIFKIVTAYAGLERGLTADGSVDCPPVINVDGRDYRNSQGKSHGTVSLRKAFAWSCNTTFVQAGTLVDYGAFPEVAKRFGIGVDNQLGAPSYSGSVPTPQNETDRASTSFGQGQVLVSPVSMAVMAATAASGVYRPPSLVLPNEDPLENETGQSNTSVAEVPLDPALNAQLQSMMAAVVTEGTGWAVKDLPGPQVHGKTGTAEYGTANPPEAHAWFVGYQGDVAFAVIVDGGGFGGSVAAPVAADFLKALAGQ